MKYKDFKRKVYGIIARAGGNIEVKFSKENGKFLARCGDGTLIICNRVSPSVAVRWGCNHQAMASL